MTDEISIHAPRVGRDALQEGVLFFWRDFNPRAPCGARRRWRLRIKTFSHFNPRAPCGARRAHLRNGYNQRYFNPRAPCGARLKIARALETTVEFQSTRPVWGATFEIWCEVTRTYQFQSTRPVWGATGAPDNISPEMDISIHAPRVGRDDLDDAKDDAAEDFNPRAPCGARLSFRRRASASVPISIHAPRVGRDVTCAKRIHP